MRWLSTAMAGCAVVTISYCVWPVELAPDLAPMRIVSVAVSEGPLRGPIVHAGVVRPTGAITVMLPPPAVVQSIEVAAHAFVHAGDLLARIDTGAFRQAAARAQAEFEAATTELAERQAALDAAERAAGDLQVSRMTADQPTATMFAPAVDRAIEDVHAANERLVRARVAVARAEEQRQQAAVRSPIAGWIAAIDRDGSQLTIAPDADRVEAAAQLDARLADTLRIGDAAVVHAAGYQAAGVITHVEPDATAAARTVVVEVAAASHELPPGEPVTIVVETARTDPVVRVPTAALEFSPPGEVLSAAGEGLPPEITLPSRPEGAGRVWIYDGSRFIAVEVRTGAHDDRFTEIVEGAVRPGDQVVTQASIDTADAR